MTIERSSRWMNIRLIWAVIFCTTCLIKIFFMEGASSSSSELSSVWKHHLNNNNAIKINNSYIDTQLIQHRLNESSQNAYNRTWEKSYRVPHFFLHIPKTGGFSLHNQINDMLRNSPFYRALPKADTFRVCNLGQSKMRIGFPRTDFKKGVKCNSFLSEAEYEFIPEYNRPRYAYALIRRPRTHVLSQYFHCAESDQHIGYRHDIPSLDKWLTHWYAAVNNPYIIEQNQEFKCYNPINLQSSYVGFHPPEEQYEGDGDMANQIRYLQQNYTVIGPMEQVEKVACVMFIHYTGWIPQACNCTSGPHTTTHRKWRTTHSVKHHGDTYNTTEEQDEKIEWLVRNDNVLYEYAWQIFDVQTRVVEEMYDFKLCDKAGNFSL